MQYEDSVNDSRQYLRLALEQIGKYELPTDPLNYCIWYEYASGKNKDLINAIDTSLGDKKSMKNGFIQKMYDEYISDRREKLNNLVRGELKKILNEVVSSVSTTNLQYSEAGTYLEDINDTLVDSLPQKKVQQIVQTLKQEVQNLEATATSFKSKLDQATAEINNLKSKLEQYREESFKDPLTGIDNRRGFDKNLRHAIETSGTKGTSLCLIMSDIDHFKEINDNNGHLVGDNVLKVVAAKMKETVKGRDLIARIGGEEFAIILPDTPFNGAMMLANDLRLTFETLDLKKKSTGESLGRITLSFGVTNYIQGESPEQFIHRADEALYQSKNSGRNRVTGKES